MGKIRLLDDTLINRIAAGEVVERPASVVKELIENSIDAGASSIQIRVEAGGIRTIEVTDDGSGMEPADARMSIQRHATSKLQSIQDLTRITSLGFRGEALASIASVSKFRLQTATDSGEGIELRVEGGKLVEERPQAMKPGTSILIEKLFYNVPARRKFLKAESTELQHIVRNVQRFALAHFPLGFQLTSGTRKIINVTPAAKPFDRIVDLLGKEQAADLLPVEWIADGLEISGFAGRPSSASHRRDRQFLFVNGRSVQDRTLNHAVMAAYENAVPKGKRAPLVLQIEMDPEYVDVNVHPQKTEVRFREGSRVHESLKAAIRKATAGEHAIPSYSDLRPSKAVVSREPVELRSTVRAMETHDRADRPYQTPMQSLANSIPTSPVETPKWWTEEEANIPQVMGQYHGGYIIAQDEEGLLFIDPHAAHERVLYECYLAEAEDKSVSIQALLFPVTVELSVADFETFMSEQESFARLGFDLEAFGDRTLKINGVPAVAAAIDAETLVQELIGEATEIKSLAADAKTLRRKLVTTAACHAAVKLKDRLEVSSMRKLLVDLARCEQSESCPHGRPTRFRLTEAEISKAFRR